jgi:D-psicose/D-tagatose/L-ribulose 3-epimerase
MRISLCNEVLAGMTLERQCAYAAALGYDGVELAPFMFSDEPHLLSSAQCNRIRRTVTDAGLAITGLRWLLVRPAGLSITSPDGETTLRTVRVIRALINLCADLGGRVLVHGSPGQRRVAIGQSYEAAWDRARVCFAAAAEAASTAGITYCIKPLSGPRLLINTLDEAVRMIEEIGNPALATIIDVSETAKTETMSPTAVIRRWMPTGRIGHVHFNDRNRRGPGQGEDRFAPLLRALAETGYRGDIGIDPHYCEPDGRGAAARAIGYVRGILEATEFCRTQSA